MKNKTALAVLCVALGNIIWGVSYPLITYGSTMVSDTYIMLGHRFTISAFVMLIMMIFGKNKLSFKGKHPLPLILLMALQTTYYLFEAYGILYTNSTISGLVLAVVPVVTIGTGALFLKEYPTRRQALFCILPVVGVILISATGKELEVKNLYLGGLFLLLTLLTSAFYKTVNRKASEEFSSFERTFMMLSGSAVVFTVIGLKLSNWSVAAYVAPLGNIKYLAVVFALGLLCSITANLLVNYAMNHMSVFKAASFGALSTLCSALLGVFVMGDKINASIIIGGALILIGVRQVTKPPKESKEAEIKGKKENGDNITEGIDGEEKVPTE